jgi:hypothetical protein
VSGVATNLKSWPTAKFETILWLDGIRGKKRILNVN